MRKSQKFVNGLIPLQTLNEETLFFPIDLMLIERVDYMPTAKRQHRITSWKYSPNLKHRSPGRRIYIFKDGKEIDILTDFCSYCFDLCYFLYLIISSFRPDEGSAPYEHQFYWRRI